MRTSTVGSIVNLNCSYPLLHTLHARFCVKLAAVSQIRLKALFLLQNVFSGLTGISPELELYNEIDFLEILNVDLRR